MATGGAIRAGRAYVEISGDAQKLYASMRTIEAKFKAFGAVVAGWGKSVALAGAAILAPLAMIAKKTGDLGDDFYNMSRRTGASVESLSELSYAASQSGASLEDLEGSIKFLQKGLGGEGEEGTKKVTEALDDLGISADALRAASPDKQLEMIADAMARVTDPARRTADAVALLGRNGTALLPLMADGAGGMQALREQAHKLGLTMSTEDARAANAFNDKMSELHQVLGRVGFQIGSILLPALTTMADITENVIATTSSWIKANKEAVAYVAMIGTALVTTGVAIYAFGTALSWAMGVMLAVQAGLAATWTVITVIAGAVSTIVTSPILATIAVVVALGAAFIYFSGIGGKAIDGVGEKLGMLLTLAQSVFRGIADAILAGNIELAAKIVWDGLKMAWLTGVAFVQEKWHRMLVGMTTAVYGWKHAIEGVFDSVAKGVVKGLGEAAKYINHLLNQYDKFRTELIGSTYNGVNVGAAFARILPKMPIKMSDEFLSGQVDIANKAADEIQKALARDREKELKDAIAKIPDNSVGTKEELAKLNAELAALITQASVERNAFRGGPREHFGPEFQQAMAVDAMQASLKSLQFGTFSAQAASMGGVSSSPIERHTKTTAEQCTLIREGIDDLKNQGGVSFA